MQVKHLIRAATGYKTGGYYVKNRSEVRAKMTSELLNVPKKLPILYIPGGIVYPGVSVRFKISSPQG